MKFGIIGAGMIARFHAKAIDAMEGSEVHSAFDLRGEAVDAFSKEVGCQGYHDLDAFLADPELEIVTIGTPSGAHLEPAVAAAKAGKHVICEKPLEVTLERCDQIIAACEEAGVTLAGVFSRRFHPAVEVLKKAVDEGRFGRLTMCDAYTKWYRDQAYYDSGAWRGTWKLDGGGALMNQSIHLIDQLIYLAGDVKSVCASTACLAHTDIEVEDTAVAILEFKNGARGVIQGSTACWSSKGHPAEVDISGDQGSAFLADGHFRCWDFAEKKPADTEIKATMMQGAEVAGIGANDPSAIDFTGHKLNFEDVVAAIAENKTPRVDGHEARKAVALICAIYESAQNDSKKVTL